MDSKRTGLLTAIAAFLMWGFAAIFWREIREVASDELLAHRALWSALSFLIILGATRSFPRLFQALRQGKNLRILLLSTLLISVNWFTFVYAIQTDRLLHASLGYFINPMVNIVCGILFFSETLRPLQKLALLFVGLGVAARGLNVGDFPWISFVLAGSFATYGVVRKKAEVDALLGNAAETFIMLPLALAYLGYLHLQERLHFLFVSSTDDLLLALTGPVTLLPMLCFCDAARRIPLSWLGQLQYIAPTLQFLLAIYYFGEKGDFWTWTGFGLVWIGLAVSAFSALGADTKKAKA